MLRCSQCERPILDSVGIITMTFKTPRLEETFHFCSGICVTPWMALRNEEISGIQQRLKEKWEEMRNKFDEPFER